MIVLQWKKTVKFYNRREAVVRQYIRRDCHEMCFSTAYYECKLKNDG